MTKSVILMVLVSIMVIGAALSFNASAICKNCGAEEDWSKSASNFLEGKPINDTPPTLSNPQRNRLANSDFNSTLLKENTGNSANSANNPAVTTLDIGLKNINALPNPANPGSPVMITASFENNSSNSQGISGTNMTVYATINNSAGVEAGKVNLEHTSGLEYAGIWNSNPTAGVYKATIVASASGASKMFNDALQIDVGKAS